MYEGEGNSNGIAISASKYVQSLLHYWLIADLCFSSQWIKAVTILERASKLAFLKPSRDSDYTKAWKEYTNALRSGNSQASPPSPPPVYLNQPKHRNPKEYRECLLALNNLRKSLGVEGISPLERKRTADAIGAQLVIPARLMQLVSDDRFPSKNPFLNATLQHHHLTAAELLLHDINCTDADNSEAIKAAHQSVDLIRWLPQVVSPQLLSFHMYSVGELTRLVSKSYSRFDGEISVVLCFIAKCLIKELGRLKRAGDDDGKLNYPINFCRLIRANICLCQKACESVSEDVDVMINELHRLGGMLHMSLVWFISKERSVQLMSA